VPAHGTVMYRVAGGTSGGGTGVTGAVHAVGAGKCLDVPDSTRTAGTQVEIWSCNGGANQTWTHSASNTGVQPGLCPGVAGGATADGTLAELQTCNGSSQRWTLG
jgi:alpha-galactosidase